MSILEKIGFEKNKVDKKKLSELHRIKKSITDIYLKDNKNINFKNIEDMHLNKNLTKDLNEFRLKMITKMNKITNIQSRLFNIFNEELFSIFGKDIVGQKNINLVIQKPYDKNRAPLHRDSPPNSPFEVVVWIPLVDCKKTMSMYLFNHKKINKTLKFISKENLNEGDTERFAKDNGELIDVKFGEYIIFWSKIFHYIPINQENKTRWSLNNRYKNTFSPYGSKGYLDYFEPISYSNVSNLALKYHDE